MTDYLEWASQDGADTLLEEYSRLEWVDLSAHHEQADGEQMSGLAKVPPPEEKYLPLMGQLIRAEELTRQVAAPGQRGAAEQSLAPARPGKGFEPVQLGGPERTGRVGLSGHREENVDAAGLARQVDLAFRRDSRRYDSGFYLY